jgi:hypothetical protein
MEDAVIKDDRDKFEKCSATTSKILLNIVLLRLLRLFVVTDENHDKFEIFEKWLADNGTRIPKLELRVRTTLFSPKYESKRLKLLQRITAMK